jgi:NitT/TauT family transport system substrate-binding protein
MKLISVTGGVMRWRLSILCALLSVYSAGAHASDKLRVGKPTPNGFDFAILDVGVAKGFYKQQGLDIEPVVLEGSAKVTIAITSGSIDISLGTGTDFAFVAKGAPERGVAAMAGPPLNMAFIVRSADNIRSVSELKGKKVAVSTVGSLTSWLAQQLSRHEGWGNDGFALVASGGGPSMAAALLAGNVDATSSSLEGGLALEEAGKGKILLAYGDVIHEFLTHVIFASNDIAAKNPDAVRRFLKAWFETVVFMNQHKDEAIRLSRPVTGLSEATAARVYDIEMPMYFTDGHFDPKAVDVVRKSLVDMNLMPSDVPDKALFTEAFLSPGR